MSNLPPDHIDEWIQGDDRKLLEIFYEAEEAELSEVGSAILRGIKAVLAHPSQMVEITYEGRVYRMPPGGKVIICNVGDATDFRALCAKVIAYNEGQSPYNFSQLNSHERDNAAYDAWVELKDEIKSALAATANDRLISSKSAVAQPMPAPKPVAWCRSDDFNDAAAKRQSFSGWREKWSDCDIALYAYPIDIKEELDS